MSVIAQSPTGQRIAFMKGATERTLGCCVGYALESGEVEYTSVEALEAMIFPRVEELARDGLRVLTLARRILKTDTQETEQPREAIEEEMVFLGLVGIYDPPREESKPAVERCHRAGITVHMLTGDHLATAAAIARQVSILPEGENSHLCMTAQAFDKLTEEQVDALPELPLVVARCSPETKVKMMEALHRRRKIAGMTGDGVNDSPSLKEADVGIAMGQTGSDVAKQTSDIILTDDNFATIISAIEEGRRVFANISRFVVHLLTANVALVVLLLIGLVFQDEQGVSVFALSPLQILFVNVLVSSPPAMALGLEPVNPTQMLEPPRKREHGLFRLANLADIFIYGVFIGAIGLINFTVSTHGWGNGDLGEDCNMNYNDSCENVFRARGGLFLTMTVILLLHSFTCRDLLHSMWNFRFFTRAQNLYLYYTFIFGFALVIITIYVPVLNDVVFRQHGITWEWGMSAASAVVYIIFTEIYKYVKRRVVSQ